MASDYLNDMLSCDDFSNNNFNKHLTIYDCGSVISMYENNIDCFKRIEVDSRGYYICKVTNEEIKKFLQSRKYIDNEELDLELSNCHFLTNAIFQYFANSLINTLSLRYCKNITDENIGHLRFLIDIDLSCTRITDEALIHLTNIEILDITGCQITDKGLTNLSKFSKQLTNLNLSYCYGITDKGLMDLGLLKLEHLDLSECSGITMDGVLALNYEYLKYLNLTFCQNVIGYDFHCLRNLHTLILYACDVSDEDIKHLGNLHTLDLGYCNNVTDFGISFLSNLHELNLSGCYEISDDGIKHLGGLNTLYLCENHKITDHGIMHLQKVENLSVNQCGNVTNIGLLHLDILRNVSIKY